MEKHCDLGHILKPDMRAFFPAEENPSLGVGRDATLLSLDLQVQPFTMSHLLPPGTYRLRLLIAAANAKPVERSFEIIVTGNWLDDEARMLSEGVALRIV